MPRSRAYQFKAPTSETQIAVMHAAVCDGVTNRPGVYRMIAEDGEIVYVGKSKQLRSRLLSYFRASYPTDKAARIIREANRIEWDYEPSEFAALLRELRMIKKYRPRLNVAMKRDVRHYAFIKISRGAAPKLTVVRGPSGDDAVTYYGPFVGAGRVEEALRELNDVVGLRDCRADQKMYFSDQREFFQFAPRTPGCIRYEVNRCIGPCVGACTVAQYAHRLQLARAFLDGESSGPMDTLREEMEVASAAMQYERAASFRDKLSRLEALREQFKRLRFAVETLSFVYNVPGVEGDDKTYLIRRGVVRSEVKTPRSKEEKLKLRALVDEIFSSTDSTGASIPTHEIDELLLLSSWFRKFPGEMERAERAE